jgi:hypothetical protein
MIKGEINILHFQEAPVPPVSLILVLGGDEEDLEEVTTAAEAAKVEIKQFPLTGISLEDSITVLSEISNHDYVMYRKSGGFALLLKGFPIKTVGCYDHGCPCEASHMGAHPNVLKLRLKDFPYYFQVAAPKPDDLVKELPEREGPIAVDEATLDMSVKELKLSKVITTALTNVEIPTVRALIQKTVEEIEAIKYIGLYRRRDIENALETLGLQLGMEIDFEGTVFRNNEM